MKNWLSYYTESDISSVIGEAIQAYSRGSKEMYDLADTMAREIMKDELSIYTIIDAYLKDEQDFRMVRYITVRLENLIEDAGQEEPYDSDEEN